MALFNAVSEIAILNRDAIQAHWLGGSTAFQISLKPVYQENEVLHSLILPRDFIEIAQTLSNSVVLKLNNQIYINSFDRLSTRSVKVIIYSDVLDESTAKSSIFLPCALSQATVDMPSENTLMSLASGWRCNLISMPRGLNILKGNYDSDTIAFPLSRHKELFGSRALDDVELVWLGIADLQKLNTLLKVGRDKYKLDLEVQPLGVNLGVQTKTLSSVTKIWTIAAALMLLLGIGLYTLGTYAGIRREIGLRICLGASLPRTTSWLITDILTQSLLLCATSAVVGLTTHYMFGGQIELIESLSLISCFVGIMVVLFSSICIIILKLSVNRPELFLMIRH